ncbi:unnamed protein product [Meloidogyne enterolobii]|uniref:Uncharacterized protein n=1 Tax=Meloidogyne enterolobii TaxID=390850 RepID=A0ACB0Z568_MELEN
MSDLRQLRESGQIEKPSIINQQSASNVKIANKKILPKTLGALPTTTKLASTAPPVPPHRGNSAGVTATTITTNSNNLKKNTTVFASNPIPFSRPCRCPTQHQQQQQQQQAFSKIQNSRCRSEPRNDGGRFSMRPTSATRANTNALRQTASSNAAKLKAAEEEKMLGWLRRKEYDPRRAVAEAEQQQQQHLLLQQQQQLRKQQEAFTSNRSISATLTNQEQQQNSKQQSSFSRWKAAQQKQQQQLINKPPPLESHRSHDELNRLAEVCDDEDDSIGLTSDSCNTSLQRTVDELTQKCHKSIALLK